MSRKRHRERPTVDTRLVEIYEDLANVDEIVRLKAAQILIVQFIDVDLKESDGEHIRLIIRRLFRGLCSGRKAARIGFSVALTEALITLNRRQAQGETVYPPNTNVLINVLEQETKPPSSALGPEEREHVLGQIFGAKAIIQSDLPFADPNHEELWTGLLDLLLGLARHKTWARQECGFILWSCISAGQLQRGNVDRVNLVLKKLAATGLARTPEGIAIWVSALRQYPGLKCPSGIWQESDPLSEREKSSIARILKEASSPTSASNPADDSFNPQTGFWTAKHHFAWDAIIDLLLHPSSTRNGHTKTPSHRMEFAAFWTECIDNSLFAPASTDERKFWGFSLVESTIPRVSRQDLATICGVNFLRCFANQLSASNRFLHLAAQKVRSAILARATENSGAALVIFSALSQGAGFDFDKITKSKILERILNTAALSSPKAAIDVFKKSIVEPGSQEEDSARTQRNAVVEQLVRCIQAIPQDQMDLPKAQEFIQSSLMLLASCLYRTKAPNSEKVAVKPSFDVKTTSYLRSRFHQCLSIVVTKSQSAPSTVSALVSHLLDLPQESIQLIELDRATQATLQEARSAIETFRPHRNHQTTMNNSGSGLQLLLSLTIIQVYDGEPEALEVLLDLLAMYKEQSSGAKLTDSKQSAALIDILLGTISKPSRLSRQLSLQVFSTMTSNVEPTGLDSMLRVLLTKENAAGQAEIYEEPVDDEPDSNSEDLASDVEVVEAADETSSAASSSDSSAISEDTASSNSDDEEESSEELSQFNAKLAIALGTRTAIQDLDDGDQSSADSDMTDGQMEELDTQLAKVFREREKARKPKPGQRTAKENITNFKCRVVELLDIYIKKQHKTLLPLQILLPLLKLIRTTTSSLVSKKCCDLVREYARLCKGEGVAKCDEPETIFSLLRDVHGEVGNDTSNAHASACSAASLLLVRILVADKKDHLKEVIQIYGSTQERMLFDSHCHVKTAFFTEWLNWCSSVKK